MILDIRAATVDDASTLHHSPNNLVALQEQAGEIWTTMEDISRDGFGAGALFYVIPEE